MSKVDWSLAPEGATHKVPTGCWYKIDGYQVYCWSNAGNWSGPYPIRQYQDGSMEEMVKRPKQQQAWSGPEDGLPPVNERVEVLWSSITGEYFDALILAHDEDRAVFRFITGDRKGEYQADKLHFSDKFPNFRAIKTPEQIAAEKRETAIREFMDVVGIDCRVTASKAVDAGFKREVV